MGKFKNKKKYENYGIADTGVREVSSGKGWNLWPLLTYLPPINNNNNNNSS